MNKTRHFFGLLLLTLKRSRHCSCSAATLCAWERGRRRPLALPRAVGLVSGASTSALPLPLPRPPLPPLVPLRPLPRPPLPRPLTAAALPLLPLGPWSIQGLDGTPYRQGM